MEKARKSRGLVALLFLLALSSCRQVENPGKVFPQSPTVDETRSDEISRNPPPDLPVPRDMLYETRLNQSFSYLQGGVRVGRFRYWGNVPHEEVVGFYRERMPQRPYGWTLVNEESRGSATRLFFRKDDDRVEVSVSPENSATVAILYLNTQSSSP
jgi:hypothetical protein